VHEHREREDPTAGVELTPLIYDELRRMAHRLFRGERGDHTLQPTAVVHEAFLRCRRAGDATSELDFKIWITHEMRRVLVDWARRKRARKRGGGWQRITLTESFPRDSQRARIDVLELDELLTQLASRDPNLARAAELAIVGGLSAKEIAEATGRGLSTVERDLKIAKGVIRAAIDEERS
jgi:RNA polymerase sigma factor (TIGR02999 family)